MKDEATAYGEVKRHTLKALRRRYGRHYRDRVLVEDLQSELSDLKSQLAEANQREVSMLAVGLVVGLVAGVLLL